MWARRFLIIVVIATLLVVASAFAIYQFGGDVLRRTMTPQVEFAAPPPSSDPDYALAAHWLARPDIAGNPAEWRPAGVSDPPLPRPAAIFYIHPTTYLERDRWNAPLAEPLSRQRAGLFVQSQASALAAAGEVWAPRYRQAAFGAFLLDSADARRALDVAYGDVARAFAHFLAAIPPDRPIILAGHSQGALHLSRLLRAKVAGSPLAGRVIAAYVVGWPLSLTADLPALGLPPCNAPDQTGCILSWLSFAEPANPDLILDAYEDRPGATGTRRRRDDLLCTNPLTGTIGAAAAPAVNPGTLVPNSALTDAGLSPGAVGAHCAKGFLIIDGAIPVLGPFVLPGNNYHVYDYALFWGAVRADALRRTAAFADRR